MNDTYDALLKSLVGRQPLQETAIDYLVARGHAREACEHAMKKAISRGVVRFGRRFEMELVDRP